MKEKHWYLIIGAAIGFIIGYGMLGASHKMDADMENMDMSAEEEVMDMEETDGMQMNHEGMDMGEMKMNEEGLPIGVHNHPMRAVDESLPIPVVTANAVRDKMDGYNIEIVTEKFTFAPERINEGAVANEGHAHIYVNGTKISRLYGPWYNLSGKHLAEGFNTIEITLNANDHSEWAVGENHIQATLKLEK